MKATNQVIVSGRLAQDAEIRQFANSTKASFSLAISRKEQRGEEEVRSVAYQPCEMWRKNGSTDSFEILTKGQLVEITGWVKPEEFVDKTGTRRHRIIFAVNKVAVVEPEKKDTEEK